uniref:Uncharacterized protein n=1 Tax=Anguilla anguilla TaxID=7936 RepID=A0A0E9XZT4_ANGAN
MLLILFHSPLQFGVLVH